MLKNIFADNAVRSEAENKLLELSWPAMRFGFIVTGIVFFIFIVWGGIAPIDSAAVAPGKIVLYSNKKTIQHLEGGIINTLNVKEGDEVVDGQVLLTLNDSAAKARRDLLFLQLITEKAIQSRLVAERDKLDEVIFSDPLFKRAQESTLKKIFDTQTLQFKSRQETVDSQISVLGQRVTQLDEQIKGLNSQLRSIDSQLKLVRDQKVDIEKLVNESLAPRNELAELRRREAELEGRRGEFTSEIAKSREAISETNLRVLTLENDRMEKIVDELRASQQRIDDLVEQFDAAEDVLERTVVKAQQSGIVNGLQYHTIGGVISPGGVIMDIIPQDDKLVVEANLNVQDIDSVHVGLEAKVMLSAYKSRSMPMLKGKVVHVSADRFVDEVSKMPYFLTRIEIDQAEIDNLAEKIVLYPGMPAETFIVKGSRTMLQYMFDPIRDSFRRAFKET